jgi:hypothetical protein
MGRKDPCPPEYKAPEPPAFPRFCSVCGSALVPEIGPCGFDERTGKARFYHWLRCPNWSGDMYKPLSPKHAVSAAFLTSTYDARLHFGGFGVDYMDCRPAYEHPKPKPPTRRRTAAK